jgi:hypothetical protein
VERSRVRDFRPRLNELRVIGNVFLRLNGEREGFREFFLVDELRDLRQRPSSGPAYL